MALATLLSRRQRQPSMDLSGSPISNYVPHMPPAAANPWMTQTKLVVKPDCLFGKRSVAAVSLCCRWHCCRAMAGVQCGDHAPAPSLRPLPRAALLPCLLHLCLTCSGKHDLVGLKLDYTEAQQFIAARMNKVWRGRVPGSCCWCCWCCC